MSWRKTRLSLVGIGLLAAPLAADWDAGVAAFKAGKLVTAEAEFRAVIEAQPEWPGGYRMLGQTLFMGGQAEDGMLALERASELAPDDVRSALVLGQTYLRLLRYKQAVGLLENLDPADLTPVEKTVFHKTRAVALTKAGSPEVALTDLAAATKLSPKVAALHRLYAQTAEVARKPDLARQQFARAVALDPKDVRSRRAWVRLLYAAATSAEDSVAQCAQVVPEAERLVAEEASPEHLTLLAKVTLCAGLDEKARVPLLRLVKATPADWWPRYSLAGVRMRQGQWAEAEAGFESVLKQGAPPDKVHSIRGRLGYVYENQQRLDEALAQYRLAGDLEALQRVEKNIVARNEEERFRQLEAEARRIELEIAQLGESEP